MITSGDQAALSELYDRYAAVVFALVLRILGNRQEGEEVTLDIFWEIWEKADRYNPLKSTPRIYLMCLARSRAIDRLRRNHSKKSVQPTLSHDVMDTRPVAPDSRLLIGEMMEQLTEASRILNGQQRAALEMAYFSGLSHREIAQALGTPLGTVKTHIRQAIIQLRKALRAGDHL